MPHSGIGTTRAPHPKVWKPDDILGTYFTKWGYCMKIMEGDIRAALKMTVIAMNLTDKGFPPSTIGTHSLRAGGAMAMHLNGVSPITIHKQGRWSSDTFLMYIHEQVAAFSSGVSKLMAANVGFRNIAGPPSSMTLRRRQLALPNYRVVRLHKLNVKSMTYNTSILPLNWVKHNVPN